MPNSQDEKQIQMLAQRILAACVVRLGGKSSPPTTIVLKAVDPLVGDDRRQ